MAQLNKALKELVETHLESTDAYFKLWAHLHVFDNKGASLISRLQVFRKTAQNLLESIKCLTEKEFFVNEKVCKDWRGTVFMLETMIREKYRDGTLSKLESVYFKEKVDLFAQISAEVVSIGKAIQEERQFFSEIQRAISERMVKNVVPLEKKIAKMKYNLKGFRKGLQSMNNINI